MDDASIYPFRFLAVNCQFTGAEMFGILPWGRKSAEMPGGVQCPCDWQK